MSTINRLAASDVKKSALYREHQLAVQNALRAFGITSILEYPVGREDQFHCSKHGVLTREQISEKIYLCLRCRQMTEIMFYPLENYVHELTFDIGSVPLTGWRFLRGKIPPEKPLRFSPLNLKQSRSIAPYWINTEISLRENTSGDPTWRANDFSEAI